jgi:sugar lactone lactonase YvrE
MTRRSTLKALAIGTALGLVSAIPLSGVSAGEVGEVEVVHSFDAAAEELPEGIAIGAGGEMLITMGYPDFWAPGDGWIKRIDPDGTKTTLATFVDGQGPAGIITDAAGETYFARANPGDPDSRGVYRLHDDGSSERLAGTEVMLVPNGLAFDGRGGILVGDSAQGTIWRVPLDDSGIVEPWSSEQDLLGGCGGEADFGVNGVAIHEDVVYAAVTSRGLLVSIPVQEDGSAGSATIVAGDNTNGCEPDDLFGMDGIALAADGSVYALLVLQHRLVRIDTTDGSVETLLTEADGLHNASSLAFGTQDGDQQTLYMVNYAVLPPVPEASVGPAVLKLDVGVDGVPLF